MTTEEMKERLAAIDRERDALTVEEYRMKLGIEEAEGRPESHRARYARAYLAGDSDALHRLCAESSADYFRKYGAFPSQDITDDAMKILAAEHAPRSHVTTVLADDGVTEVEVEPQH